MDRQQRDSALLNDKRPAHERRRCAEPELMGSRPEYVTVIGRTGKATEDLPRKL